MKIRFCENNEGSAKVCKQLRKEFPELNIKRKDCIKNCSPCNKAPIAMVEGELLRAVDSEELYRKIVAAIKASQPE